MKEFGLQLFSIRDCFTTPEEIRASFKRIRELGYSHAQTAGGFENPDEFAAAARDAGVRICGTHYSYEKILKETDATMRLHELLGTTNVGIGGMPNPARESVDGLKRFIEEVNAVAAVLGKNGFKFTYHNHSFEFVKFEDGKSAMDYLIEGFDPKNVSFVLDTYWVQHGGYDVCKMIRRLAGRIDILHLKDMGAWKTYRLENGHEISAPYITEIGNGNLNFEDIIPLAEETGVKEFVVEQDGNFMDGDCFKSIKISADYIRANLMK